MLNWFRRHVEVSPVWAFQCHRFRRFELLPSSSRQSHAGRPLDCLTTRRIISDESVKLHRSPRRTEEGLHPSPTLACVGIENFDSQSLRSSCRPCTRRQFSPNLPETLALLFLHRDRVALSTLVVGLLDVLLCRHKSSRGRDHHWRLYLHRRPNRRRRLLRRVPRSPLLLRGTKGATTIGSPCHSTMLSSRSSSSSHPQAGVRPLLCFTELRPLWFSFRLADHV